MEQTNKYTLEHESVSIVLLGNFNPAIFHPTWFSQQELIGVSDAKESEITVITNEISIFKSSLFRFDVRQGSFAVTVSSYAQAALLKDLVIGTFRVLEHTPIRKIGINREYHYRVFDAGRWDEIGHLLAPKKQWEMLEEPKTRSVTIEGIRPGSECKYLQVKAEPSPKFPQEKVLAISTNEHFELPAPDASRILEFLEKHWEDALIFSNQLAQKVMEMSDG